MCGIVGFLGAGGSEATLRAMTDVLIHRGPNDEGHYMHGNVGLGFRRLSIIDLAGGHQPMTNEDGTVWVVFNGEIYNFQPLRAELIARGHTFKTASDTEVIVHAYEEYGDGLCERVHGMFAIALWDTRAERLLLIRDRLGKKPLYFSDVGGGVVFGSEMKALLQHPAVKREPDMLSMQLFLSYEFVPTPRTIFAGICKLAPATVRMYEHGTVRERVYWELPFGGEHLPDTKQELLNDLDARMGRAVHERLVADVPLGIFLSGGLDSSLVAAYAARYSATPVHTFSIGFADASHDERAYARSVARALRAEHHEVEFQERDALELLPELFAHMDEPLADPSIVPTTLLSRWARDTVTVALGGDGGDELFSGYPTFWMHALVEHVPLRGSFSKIITALANHVPGHDDYLSRGFVARRFARGFHAPLIERDVLWRGAFTPEQAWRITRVTAPEDVFLQEMLRWDGEGAPTETRIVTEYLRHFLMDGVLVKVDRASMLASLEVRAPLLQTDVVSFALSLPISHKRFFTHGKKILEDLMATRFPGVYTPHPKHGFSIPTATWLRGPLQSTLRDALNTLERSGLVQTNEISHMADAHAARTADYRKELWTAMILGGWMKRWL